MKFLFLNKRFIGLVALFTFSVAIMPLRVMALPSGALSILSQAERQAQVDKILDALSGPQAKPHLVMIGMDLEELETKLAQLDDQQLMVVAEKADQVKAAGDATGLIIALLVIAILVVILLILLKKDIQIKDKK